MAVPGTRDGVSRPVESPATEGPSYRVGGPREVSGAFFLIQSVKPRLNANVGQSLVNTHPGGVLQ